MISYEDEDSNHIILPRDCEEGLEKLLKEHSIKADFISEQHEGEEINVTFNGKLTLQQEEAVNQLWFC